ncbi:BACON domain-containing protein [Bacteroides caecigallinarum]|uniref:BACON domain-containing protein n=1 Tax=Bacteroides caecigallinarum TaxID=1411144 RepID=UPI001958B87E|nr:BACON domain-containing protein [Bacteroides caecigallinarum]MBM6866504.1 BACON domain-containing protein [Bacteroides caecigallinarum]
MRKIKDFIILMALTAGLFTSCKNDDVNIPGGLSLEMEELTVGPEKSFQELMVNADVSWLASSSTPWISISPANGVGSAQCVLNIDSTLNFVAREAQVRFTPQGNEPKMLKVTQFGFGKQILLDKSEVELENTAAYDDRYFDIVVTTNVKFDIDKNVEYGFVEELTPEDEEKLSEEDRNWIELPKNFDVNLDREARPRSVKIRFKWKMNTVPFTRTAKIKFVAKNADDQLIDNEGNNIDGVYLTVTQKPAMKIEDNRAGDSISVILLNQKMQCMYAMDASENMQNWSGVTLWEATDEDLPEDNAVGRVRSLTIVVVDTKESIPQEITNLKYLESLTIKSNVNRQSRDIELGPEICELKYLKKLTIGSYGLTKLPEEFVKLGGKDEPELGLEELSLESNNFKDLNEITKYVNEENFPKLKTLLLSGCRRNDTMIDMSLMESGEKWKGIHIGMYINLIDNSDKNTFIKDILSWDTLEKLEMSYGYIEGNLPTDEELINTYGFKNYKDTYGTDGGDYTLIKNDTCKWLVQEKEVSFKYDVGEGDIKKVKGTDVACVLPNAKVFSINLNYLNGELPNWILFHPHFMDWFPESMVINQQEGGKNSSGKDAVFEKVPLDFDYFYGKSATDDDAAFPLYYNKYVIEGEKEEGSTDDGSN